MNKILKGLAVFFITLTMLYVHNSAFAIEAVASIKTASGSVTVERQSKRLMGRAGLILNDKDIIVTGVKGKTTLMFRDGSIIRLFSKTRFVIDKSVESRSGSRQFINNLLLKWGSFWGKFSAGKTRTTVRTPTATAGIKGTMVSFSERNGRFSASLSSGKISVENEDSSIFLSPGKQVSNVSKSGDLKEKVTLIPYKIRIAPGKTKINIPTGNKAKKLFFTLQLVNAKTNANIGKTGSVYINVNHDKVVFPDQIKLNARGYARVQAKVLPFLKQEYGNGKLEINAIMEGENYLNVGTGVSLLTYDIPKSLKKSIKIDVKSGILSQ